MLNDAQRRSLDEFDVSGVPTGILIDSAGAIRHRFEGFRPEHREEVRQRVAQLVGEAMNGETQ